MSKNSILIVLFLSLFSPCLKAQYYDLYFDRAMDKIDILQYTGTGYGNTQQEAMENAFMDLSVKLGVAVSSSTSVSYVNGEKQVKHSANISTELCVPRDMVDTNVDKEGRKSYYVEAVLKVKDYILDCERRLADSEKYTAEYIAKTRPKIEESTAFRIGMLQYRKKVLDCPIYLNFDGKETMKRIAYCDRNIEYLKRYLGDLDPMLILDESLEILKM